MYTGHRQTSQMFLRTAIEKILADRDIKKKDNLELKKACENALEELKSEETAQSNGISNGGTVLPDREQIIEADRFFLPFELACRSKSPKIVIAALDCLQKLIAYGHLTGRGADTSNPERRLIDRIVEAICSSFNGQGTDEHVILQILKAILAASVSRECEVHEGTLLNAVKTCFTIYLATKDPINQATARGSLTQVINTVFSNMERYGNNKDDNTVVKEVVEFLVNNVASIDNVETTERRSRGAASTVADSETNEDQLTFLNIHQKDAFLVFRALCVLAQKDEGDLNDPRFDIIFWEYLIFDGPRNTHLRSKLLALDMLLLVLQNSSTVLQNTQAFIVIIKRVLCVALSKNAVSPVKDVFEKSLAIFVQLVDKFKMHLKPQIEVFFKEIIVSMLDSTSCSLEHKWIVLQAIATIVSNPQSVVDIFVNYDCDLTSHNVFAAIVDVLSKTARTTVSETAPLHQKEKERQIRLAGLRCMCDLINCLVAWFDECETSKEKEVSDTNDQDSSSELPQSPTEDKFANLKHKKELMEHGIQLFTKKPKQGLAFLQQHGFVGSSPGEIAEFLAKEDRLDKTVVGDFLGDPDEFNKNVMYEYIDDLDFSSRDFLSALRMFLENFRLPGEAQKIDRLMEKFASRYCDCNPGQGIFHSADTAYVLAYSIIMLTTDLHSSQIAAKNKMTKEGYIKMNRGIDNQGDLPPELLSAIYDDIARSGIKMKGGASKLLKSTNAASNNSDKQRRALATLEMEAISETARALMESASLADSYFTKAEHQHHARPMFYICWTPCLAAFSVGLQCSDDVEEWYECIRGFRLGIRAACILRMRLERNAFMQALARFTLLTAKDGMVAMQPKNIEAIKIMLQIGDEDGDYLEENWQEVFRCVSQLELAQLIGTGLGNAAKTDKESSRSYVLKNTGVDDRHLASMQIALGETTSQAFVVAIDRIFHGSCRLSNDAIVHFVTALCAASKDELSQPSAPRMFLLGKIVEVAFYNMDRIRLQWMKIWAVIGAHFDMAGCSTNEIVAHYSVDALRQLSIKFLERGELPNFHFQKVFLRPFEVIVNTNRSLHIREFIVACTKNLVEAHGPRLKSGWLNLFSVWKKVATDPHLDIVESAFITVGNVVTHNFLDDFGSIIDSFQMTFQEAVSCLAEFACNPNMIDTSMDAIRLIRLCGEYVNTFHDVIIQAPLDMHDKGENYRISGDQKVWLRGWFPIFFELNQIISRTALDVRTRSLTVMFELMKGYGHTFQPSWWGDLFNIVFRIFDKTKRDGRPDKRDWMMTTCNHALYSIVDVYTQYYEVLGEMLLPSIYSQFTACIQQHNEELARSTVQCLNTLILSNAQRFTDDMWRQTIELFRALFAATLPKSLLTWEPDSNGVGKTNRKNGGEEEQLSPRSNGTTHPDALFAEQIVFCVVQSELVDAVISIVLGRKAMRETSGKQNGSSPPTPCSDPTEEEGLFDSMKPVFLLSLVEALGESQQLAKQFNDNNGQRTLLWKAGLRGSSKPNLLRQETYALRAMLSILLRLLNDPRSEEVKEQVAQGVLGVVSAALGGYGEAGSETRRNAYAPVVCDLLKECLRLPPELLPKLGAEFPLRLCDLVETAEGQTLRSLLASLLRLFLDRPGPKLNGESR